MSSALPEVKLRRIGEHDFELMERWMRLPDVHAFMDFEQPPSGYDLKVELLAGHVDVLIITSPDETPVGFFFLYTRGLKGTNVRELDLAVPDVERRRQNIAKAAIVAFERWAFEEQELTGVWANIFPDNQACLALLRSCAWPLSETDVGGINFRGAPCDVVYTKMTPELLIEARARRGF